MKAKVALAVMLIIASVWIVPAAAQTYPPPTGTNTYGGWPTYDDNAADYPVYPNYPSPFVFYNGTAVTNTTQWSQRKTELYNILDYFYRGHAPPASSVSVSLVSSTDTTMGSITKRALSLSYHGQYGSLPFFINLFIPHASGGPFANGVPSNGPYPIILSGEGSWCNLDGNHRRLRWFANRVMRVWQKWLSRRDPQSVVRRVISGCGLTSQSDLETLVNRGYILAEFGRDDFSLDPNGDCTQPINCSNTGARTLYPYDDNGVTGYDWGAIQAWAWGFSRAIDYLMTLSYVDHNRVGVAGISRGADAALWAGANDSRIALTIQDQGGWLECRFNAKQWSNYPYSFYPPINNAGDFESLADRMPRVANPGGYGTSGWFNIRIWPFVNTADNVDVSTGGCNQLPFDDPSVEALIAPRAYLSSVDPSGYAMWNQTNDFVADKLIWGAFGATSKIGIFTTSFGHIMPSGAWAAFLDFADGVWFNHYVRSAMATAVTVTPGDGCCSPADYTAPYYPAANLPPSTNTWTVPNLSGATAPTVSKPRR